MQVITSALSTPVQGPQFALHHLKPDKRRLLTQPEDFAFSPISLGRDLQSEQRAWLNNQFSLLAADVAQITKLDVPSDVIILIESREEYRKRAGWFASRLTFGAYDFRSRTLILAEDNLKGQSAEAVRGVIFHELVHAAQSVTAIMSVDDDDAFKYMTEGHALLLQQEFVGLGYEAGLRLNSGIWRVARALEIIGTALGWTTPGKPYRVGQKTLALICKERPEILGCLYKYPSLVCVLFGKKSPIEVPKNLFEVAVWLSKRNPLANVAVIAGE